MVSVETIGSIFLKVFKLIINLVIILLYRFGYVGDFLGVGGTWNMNEEKSADAEIIASGVFVGFFVYTGVQLMTYLFGTTAHKRELSDTIMNVVGAFLWVSVGATAIHYWQGYIGDHDQIVVVPERTVGLVLGSLCILEGALYVVDSVLAFIHFAK